MKLQVEQLRTGNAAAIRELHALCVRCAKIGARKVGAGEFEEDIAQDMVMAVLQSFLDRYDGVSGVDSFLIEMARRMGLSYWRRHSREISALPKHEDDGDPINLAPDPDEVPIEEQAAEAISIAEANDARAQLIERIRATATNVEHHGDASTNEASDECTVEPEGEQHPEDEASPSARLARIRWYRINLRRVQRPRPKHTENTLIQCRKDTGLSQSALAAALDMSVIQLRKAEQLETLPKRLKERVAEVWAAAGKGMSEMDGPRCVERWCHQLGIDADRTTELAEQIGVHRATVYRWRTGKSHPPVYLKRKLDVMVSVLAERRQRMQREAMGHTHGR